MAKVFYVTETANDYSTAHFFKTEKEALKYGKSKVKDFNMKQDMWGGGFHDEENDTWFGGEWINTQYGILMSWEEDRVYIQSADDEEARKFIRSSRHDKQGSAIFFDSFKKGMHGSLGNDFAEGEGYTWKHHRKEYIKESKTIMKHVRLFEQFIAEKFSKKDAKQLIKDLKADGFDASGDKNWIQVDGVDSPNPDYDGTVSMAWDPIEKEAYSDDDTYTEPVETVEDFMDILNYPEDTFGKWEN